MHNTVANIHISIYHFLTCLHTITYATFNSKTFVSYSYVQDMFYWNRIRTTREINTVWKLRLPHEELLSLDDVAVHVNLLSNAQHLRLHRNFIFLLVLLFIGSSFLRSHLHIVHYIVMLELCYNRHIIDGELSQTTPEIPSLSLNVASTPVGKRADHEFRQSSECSMVGHWLDDKVLLIYRSLIKLEIEDTISQIVHINLVEPSLIQTQLRA